MVKTIFVATAVLAAASSSPAADLPAPIALYNLEVGVWGSACLVGGLGEAYTAKHVTEAVRGKGRLRWVDVRSSESGDVDVVEEYQDRDLSRLRLVVEHPILPFAPPVKNYAPSPGERLRTSGVLYGWDDRVVLYSTFLFIGGGAGIPDRDGPELYLDGTGLGGISGACVLDERGRAVAVHGGVNWDPTATWRRNPSYAVRLR